MSKILIVVDMQNDFINGSLGTKEAQAIVSNVAKKIKEYKDVGKQVTNVLGIGYEVAFFNVADGRVFIDARDIYDYLV